MLVFPYLRAHRFLFLICPWFSACCWVLPWTDWQGHKSVDGSLYPHSIIFLLKYTSHALSLNTTVHLALHNTRIPNNETTARLGTMCPLSVVGRPGMLMSHTCADLTCLQSGRLIVNGFFAGCLFLASTPSMTKIDVAPVSAIASSVAIISAFKYCGIGFPYTSLAAAAIDDTRLGGCLCIVLLDVTTVSS